MDSRRASVLAIAIVILLFASAPILYPLAVAAAACCIRRLPQNIAQVAGLVIIFAILAGTVMAQAGLLPLAGPWRANGESLWRGWPGWGVAIVSGLGVWAVVKWASGQADGLALPHRSGAALVDGDPSPAGRVAVNEVSPAKPGTGIELGSDHSRLEWNQPTQICFPTDPSGISHLTYDLDAAAVLDTWLERTSAATFRDALVAADLSTLDAATLPAFPGDSTAEIAKGLIAEGKLTAYQAVLICAGLQSLLKIDEFEVLDRLGRGGMAIVLRVRHIVTGHLYALKLLEEPDPIDPASRNRFLREMEAVCGLAHPSIAVAHSVGQQGNRLHIAMELVEGQNLAELVAQQGPLPPGRALDFAAQAARALAHAHECGLVHRDVKPGNLMVGPGDQIKLVDMGLARFIDAIESQLTSAAGAWHTHTGHLIGTIDYMAPEQAEELAVSDRRSDIYSLGCTLFFLLTGTSHLRGQSQRRRAISLISRRGMTDLRALRNDLPECLYDLVSRMTQLEPEARFQTMPEVIEAMDQCGRELGVGSPRDQHFRVLMVEDSLTQSILTRQKIKATSPHVAIQSVTSLAEALAARRNGRFDIVLLDLNLPDSMGVATVTEFRRADAVTPIVVMTSSQDPELRPACLAAGAEDFLPKQDIQPAMLQRHILLAMGRRRTPVETKP